MNFSKIIKYGTKAANTDNRQLSKIRDCPLKMLADGQPKYF